jgi:exopolysaccharide biosynthesis protein
MMIIIEGRFTDSPGCSVVAVADKLLEYGCMQALNLDGGTSAIMYYDGEYVTRCSNTAIPSGRTMPTAWVYKKNS